jgi:RNA polymerase sigma-70 factor (ECF subfamily)
LCFFCNGYVKDLDKARSLVQQIFVELWVKKDHLNIKYNIKSYLYNAVKNKAIDYIRQQKNMTQITENINDLMEVPFHDLIQEAETLEQINKSINQLPEKCKEVFLLCRFEGMKYKDIANKLNISIKTVEMQMGIALKKIKEKLTDNKSLNLFLSFFRKKI